MDGKALIFRRRQSGDDSLIPMINIVFLLLIFFMVAGHISSTGSPAVSLPFADIGNAAQEQPYRLEINENNELTLNGEPSDLAAVDKMLDNADTATIRIALLADKRLTVRELDRLLAIIRAHRIASVSLFSDSGDGNDANISGSRAEQ
ncbi:MAG: ExbD/TolR family protein [Porticoccaceae bacterium]